MRGLLYYWKQIPTQEQYLEKYGLNKIVCYKCRSEDMLNIGLIHFVDNRRKVLCAKCKAQLYREED
jgi:ribosomal protein L40E